MILIFYLCSYLSQTLASPSVSLDYEKKVPLITAHRGSMWYFPEHTSAAYYYSFFEGADFIDVDLQPTKDGHFMVFHDIVITHDEVDGLTPENGFEEANMNQETFTNTNNGKIYPP